MTALTHLGFGLTIVGFAWTILGCSSATVHVVSADSAAFQQLLDAETTAQSRRPAHLMKQFVHRDLSGKVSVLDNEKLPEAYTQNDAGGGSSSQYHLGYAALRLIREHYAAAHPAQQVLENGDLVEIVDKAGGNLLSCGFSLGHAASFSTRRISASLRRKDHWTDRFKRVPVVARPHPSPPHRLLART